MEKIYLEENLERGYKDMMEAVTGKCIPTVNVIKKPLVGIIPVSNEFVPPTTGLKNGEIQEFNFVVFTGMLNDLEVEAFSYQIVWNDLDVMKTTQPWTLDECDVVVLNTGPSAGSNDYNHQIIKPRGVAMLFCIYIKIIICLFSYFGWRIIVIKELMQHVIKFLKTKKTECRDFSYAIISKPVVSLLKYLESVLVRHGITESRLSASPLNWGAVLEAF